jgi:hypothetical protein
MYWLNESEDYDFFMGDLGALDKVLSKQTRDTIIYYQIIDIEFTNPYEELTKNFFIEFSTTKYTRTTSPYTYKITLKENSKIREDGHYVGHIDFYPKPSIYDDDEAVRVLEAGTEYIMNFFGEHRGESIDVFRAIEKVIVPKLKEEIIPNAMDDIPGRI